MAGPGEGSVFGKAGKRKKGPTTADTRQLSEFARALFEETTGTRRQALSQTEELLRTGGVGAQVPIVQRAVEASRRATSTSLRGLDERLGATGLAGTPFGEGIRGEAAIEGALATSRVPTEVGTALLDRLLPLLQSQLQTSIAGAGGAAEATARIRASDTAALAQQKISFWDNVFTASTLGAGAAGGGAGAAGG